MATWSSYLLLLRMLFLPLTDAVSSSSFREVGRHVAAGIGLHRDLDTSVAVYDGGNNTAFGSATLQATGTKHTVWPSAAGADQCWAEWQKHWANTGTKFGHWETSTVTTVLVEEQTYWTWSDLTITDIYLVTVSNGGFPISTYTTTTDEYLATTLSDAKPSTRTRTITETETEVTRYKNHSMATTSKPSCQLPTPYYQCQSQWSTWASRAVAPYPQPWNNCSTNEYYIGNPVKGLTVNSQPLCYTKYNSVLDAWYTEVQSAKTPRCQAASVTGSMCASLKDAYVAGRNSALFTTLIPEGLAPVAPFSEGYYQTPSGTTWGTWVWPTSSAMAPGCTLGCGRCAVTGGLIQLLYFPPGLTHPATAPVTAITLGTTFTSPTYYISFSRIYGANACGPIGPNITSTIVPVPTDATLSSVWGSPYPWGEGVLQMRTHVELYTASFNITDLLKKPVPYSIYSSQPWCATFRFQPNSMTHCPATAPYKPILVVPNEVLQNINPAFAQCSADLRGLYDPPHALQPATAIAGPSMTAPNDPPTQPATPASGLQSPPIATATIPTGITTTHGPAPSHGSDPVSSQNNDPNTDEPDATSQIASRQHGTAKPHPIPGSAIPPSPKPSNAPGSADPNGDPASQRPGHIGSMMASLLGAGATRDSSAEADPSETGERTNDPESPPSPPPTSSVNVVISILSAAEASLLSSRLDPSDRLNTASPDLSMSGPDPVSPGPASIARTGPTVITPEDPNFTAVRSGHSVILHDGASTLTVHVGSQTEFGGQTVSVGLGGSRVVANGKTISVSNAEAAATSEAIFTAGGQTFTAIDKSGSAILEDESSTTTVKYGSAITFQGESISVESSGAAIVVSGETVRITGEAATRSKSDDAGSGLHSTMSSIGSNAPFSNSAVARTTDFKVLAASILAAIVVSILQIDITLA